MRWLFLAECIFIGWICGSAACYPSSFSGPDARTYILKRLVRVTDDTSSADENKPHISDTKNIELRLACAPDSPMSCSYDSAPHFDMKFLGRYCIHGHVFRFPYSRPQCVELEFKYSALSTAWEVVASGSGADHELDLDLTSADDISYEFGLFFHFILSTKRLYFNEDYLTLMEHPESTFALEFDQWKGVRPVSKASQFVLIDFTERPMESAVGLARLGYKETTKYHKMDAPIYKIKLVRPFPANDHRSAPEPNEQNAYDESTSATWESEEQGNRDEQDEQHEAAALVHSEDTVESSDNHETGETQNTASISPRRMLAAATLITSNEGASNYAVVGSDYQKAAEQHNGELACAGSGTPCVKAVENKGVVSGNNTPAVATPPQQEPSRVEENNVARTLTTAQQNQQAATNENPRYNAEPTLRRLPTLRQRFDPRWAQQIKHQQSPLQQLPVENNAAPSGVEHAADYAASDYAMSKPSILSYRLPHTQASRDRPLLHRRVQQLRETSRTRYYGAQNARPLLNAYHFKMPRYNALYDDGSSNAPSPALYDTPNTMDNGIEKKLVQNGQPQEEQEALVAPVQSPINTLKVNNAINQEQPHLGITSNSFPPAYSPYHRPHYGIRHRDIPEPLSGPRLQEKSRFRDIQLGENNMKKFTAEDGTSVLLTPQEVRRFQSRQDRSQRRRQFTVTHARRGPTAPTTQLAFATTPAPPLPANVGLPPLSIRTPQQPSAVDGNSRQLQYGVVGSYVQQPAAPLSSLAGRHASPVTRRAYHSSAEFTPHRRAMQLSYRNPNVSPFLHRERRHFVHEA